MTLEEIKEKLDSQNLDSFVQIKKKHQKQDKGGYKQNLLTLFYKKIN